MSLLSDETGCIMGIEYCCKSNIRMHKSNIRERIFFPRALFQALASNIVACEEKNNLSVRRVRSQYFPLLARADCSLVKSPLLARENFHSARASDFF